MAFDPKRGEWKVFVAVNGVRQGMFLRSADTTNPVLLFLHGGPGMPEYFLDRTHPTGLEHDFTVCWWEQRGAGISFSPGIPPESMTTEQLIRDTIAVTDYLRGALRPGADLPAGPLLGELPRHPGRGACAGAVPRLHRDGAGRAPAAVRGARLRVRAGAVSARPGDDKMVRALEAAPVTMDAPLPAAYMRVRDAAMHRIGIGTTRDMTSVVTGIFVPVWLTPDYTVAEKIAIWRGKTPLPRRHVGRLPGD